MAALPQRAGSARAAASPGRPASGSRGAGGEDYPRSAADQQLALMQQKYTQLGEGASTPRLAHVHVATWPHHAGMRETRESLPPGA